MSATVDDLVSKAAWEEKLKILEWISTDTPSDIRNDLLQTAKMGSDYRTAGSWLFEHPSYCAWIQSTTFVELQSKAQCLWSHGPPGTGKSSATARAIESLLENRALAQNEAVTFFYCQKGQMAQADNHSEIVLRSILRQLTLYPHSEHIQAAVDIAYRRKRIEKSSLKKTDCLELLTDIIPSYEKVVIMVDALDECGQSQVLLSHLANLYSKVGRRVRLFFSGRDNVQLPRQFARLEINMSETDTSPDLLSFIHNEVEKRQFYHDDLFEDSESGRGKEQAAKGRNRASFGEPRTRNVSLWTPDIDTQSSD